MDDWRATAALQHGVVRRGDGLTKQHALREVRTGALVPLGRHALVSAMAPATAEQALWAVVMEVGAPVAISGVTALSLYGVPVAELPDRVEVLVPRDRARRRVDGARVQLVVARELARRRTAGGLPVVSVPVAVRRAGVELPLRDYVTTVEHVLRLRLATESQLRRALGHGLVGAGRLREALAIVSAESHSLWERRLARLIRAAGLPKPRRQARAGTEYWVDFLFEPWALAVEVDGFSAHARPDAFVYGLRRARQLRLRAGIEVLTYAPVEIRDNAPAVVGEIAEALARRGAHVRRDRVARIS